MMDSAFAKMGFSTYTPSSIACVIKDVPIFDTPAPVRASADAPFVSAEQFSALISQLYEAAMDPEGWKPFLETLRLQLGGNYASLIVRPGYADDVGLIVSAAGDRRCRRRRGLCLGRICHSI